MIDFISDQPAALGECPVWDGRTGHVYWIDIDGLAVGRKSLPSGLEERRSVPGRPGSIALTSEPNRLLAAIEHEVGWLYWDEGRFEAWVALEVAGTANRLNDGRADAAGRFWVGSMHADASDESRTGMLHRLEPDGSHVTTRGGIGVSNGLAFSPDGRTMYHADTLEDTVWCYDYDTTTGELRHERVFTDFAGLPGRPDGACVDTDGCYWIACVFGSAVARLTPSGLVDRVIELPVQKPTMPAFGGTDLDILFITSIGGGGTHEVDDSSPDDGRLLAIDVGISGLPEPHYDG